MPTVKHSKGVMVWGCFIKGSLGPLIQVDETITGSVYEAILQNHLLPFIEALNDDFTYLFQDDNVSVHRTPAIIEFKDNNLITSLSWPAQNPDLNPIEHLWDVLERKVHARQPLPKNLCELMVYLKEEWYKIDLNTLENLVNSMPRRIEAVIQSNGNPTRY